VMSRAMEEPKTNSLPVRLRRVLDEAEQLFTQEGFLHFSTDELCAAAEMLQAHDLCGCSGT